MSIQVQTSDPNQLLSAIFEGARNKTLRTWEVGTSNHISITHMANQWRRKAYFFLEPGDGVLTLTLRIEDDVAKKDRLEVFAEYHGHALRMLIADFRPLIGDIKVDPQA